MYKNFPELKEYVSSAIVNRSFGLDHNNPSVINEYMAIQLIESNMKAQGVSNIDIVVGGPPCQAYSIIGRSRMGDFARIDERNFLFRYYVSIVSHFKPTMFIIENVPGLLSAQDGQMIHMIRDEFNQIGYTILWGQKDDKPEVHCVADYGVNQKRQRLILVGFYGKKWPSPSYPEFSKYAIHFEEPQTTYNTICDLPNLNAGSGNDFWFGEYSKDPDSEYEKTMRINSEGVQNHMLDLTGVTILRYTKRLRSYLHLA
jgi:DNA (cytosine-5)-methyltransferase 1